MFNSIFGKYRFLVVSIALFLVFDLGVLVLNLYTSGKIAEQTERINLAGRQRTLTQQMSKATLYIKSQKLQQWVYQSGLEELREHFDTFGATLKAFNEGGVLSSADTGLPVTVQPVQSSDGREILQRANILWAEFETAIQPLMVDTLVTDEEIQPASQFIAANNLALYKVMDDLTQHFTRSSERQTSLLRLAQLVGISLATINFFIILHHFLGQLRRREVALQKKQHESDQILSTIGEAVFLLDKDLIMSGQHSKQLEEIFATDRVSGRKFAGFLKNYLPKKSAQTALKYIDLFFRKHIDPRQIQDVNPLKRVEASITSKDGETKTKYLDFSFAKLDQDDGEPGVLVTVKDVTAEILLETQELKNADDLEQKMAMLTQILPIPTDDLNILLTECNGGFDRINAALKNTKHAKDNYRKTFSEIGAVLHKLKGNASAVSFDWMVDQLHSFEDGLEELSDASARGQLTGQDLLPLTMRLKSGYDGLELIAGLRESLTNYGVQPVPVVGMAANTSMSQHREAESVAPENQRWQSLHAYVDRISKQSNCQTQLSLRGFDKPLDQGVSDQLYSASTQLVRNSIAHGIEGADIRVGMKKPVVGQISISVSEDGRGNYRFVYQDDGRGFDYESIRSKLVADNVVSQLQADGLHKQDLVRYAFTDKFSTKGSANNLAGRGVGLPVVWQAVKALDGQLKVRSVQFEFTQFIIDFTEPSHDQGPLITRKAG